MLSAAPNTAGTESGAVLFATGTSLDAAAGNVALIHLLCILKIRHLWRVPQDGFQVDMDTPTLHGLAEASTRKCEPALSLAALLELSSQLGDGPQIHLPLYRPFHFDWAAAMLNLRQGPSHSSQARWAVSQPGKSSVDSLQMVARR